MLDTLLCRVGLHDWVVVAPADSRLEERCRRDGAVRSTGDPHT